jgi:putative PIN family toxin of toxin-antitoxin system
MPLKVVLDTNLIVSAHLNADGLERKVLTLALASQVEFFITPEIFEEYEEVLVRKKFGIDPELVAESLQLIKQTAGMVQSRGVVKASPDPDDNIFLECAEAAGADFLVTGNKKHFPNHWKKTKVINAREFIEIITPDLLQ